MANGQAVLSSAVLDTAAVDRLCARLEQCEADRHGHYAAQLADALALDAAYREAGMELQTTAVLALSWRCSEDLAARRLREADVLDRLGALAVMAGGRLTVEQGRVVVDVLGEVAKAVAGSVWERLRSRLEQDARVGAVLPPARCAELLRSWLIEADREGAVRRRQDAERDRAGVDLWRRDDGLIDVSIRGLTGPNAQACGQRIRDHADPIGLGDQRSAGQRLRDAATDLILGRTSLPFPAHVADPPSDGVAPRCGHVGCGCTQAQPVPCGASVQVLVPLASALDTSDVPAELVGHGPIEPDLLQSLLLADPVLTRVWVDPESGVPVAVDDRTWTPGRGDPAALRAALLDIATGDPPLAQVPIHPDDHARAGPDMPRPPDDAVLAAAALGTPVVLTHAHPAGAPGSYIVPRRLRRLLLVRAPRCEWPGCGRRALVSGVACGCDVDHDLAWPAGPTCGCNCGPLCRRHHRIKQLGWTKQHRVGGHVRWISQTGRRWLSRAQLQPPPRQVRRMAPLPAPGPLDELTDAELIDALWLADPADPIFDGHDRGCCPDEPESIEVDILGARYARGGLWARIDDPTAWHDVPDPAEPPSCDE